MAILLFTYCDLHFLVYYHFLPFAYRKPATCIVTSGWHDFLASKSGRTAEENHPFLQLLELSGRL